MTHITNNYSSTLNALRKNKFYTVEIITFDGESYTEVIEARTAEAAQQIAARMYDEVDYTMVQGCYAV